MPTIHRLLGSIPGTLQLEDLAQDFFRSRSTPKRVARLLDSREPIHLDLGAGEEPRPGWVTLDMTKSSDLYWDLRKGIPFPSGTVDSVYSSHLLEHMPYQAGQDLLQECLRVLKPGASIFICVPNARLYIDAYTGTSPLSDSHGFWEPARSSDDAIDLLNYVAYMGGAHACMFDQDSLVARLQRSGFVDVSLRTMDPTIDLPWREFESIYARGRRPT